MDYRHIYLALFVAFLFLGLSESSSSATFPHNVFSNLRLLDIECEACEFFVDIFAKAADNVVGISIAKALAKDYCKLKKIVAPVVCDGVINEFAPEFLYIAAHLSKDERKFACAKMHMCSTNVTEKVSFIPNLASLAISKPSSDPALKKSAVDIGKFVHVTDLHVDTLYKVGSRIDCGLPLCCRNENGLGTSAETSAPKFGTLFGDCDVPIETLVSSVHSMSQHNPDFVLLTGDFPPHDIWEQSQEKNIGYQREILSIFAAVLGNTSTFPVLGNHGSFPVNQFRGPGYDSWLYNASYDLWSHCLPPAVRSEIEFGGYYSTLIRPGLRAVCLNSQLWMDYSDNYWQLLPESSVWQEQQWTWLQNVFAEANQKGEKIYILTHLTWHSLMPKYVEGFSLLLQKYPELVVAGFGGHSHADYWEIFKTSDKRPIGMHFVSPSLTTYSGLNPSYRVFSYDRATFELVDTETYFANLTSGNARGQLTWELAYSAKAAYNMTGMKAENWQKVNDELAVNQKLFDFYFKNYNQQQVAAPGPSRQCDAGCKKSQLCTLNTATPKEEAECNAQKMI